jgi:hypothetical protein
LSKIHPSVAIITAYDIKSTGRTGNAKARGFEARTLQAQVLLCLVGKEQT